MRGSFGLINLQIQTHLLFSPSFLLRYPLLFIYRTSSFFCNYYHVVTLFLFTLSTDTSDLMASVSTFLLSTSRASYLDYMLTNFTWQQVPNQPRSYNNQGYLPNGASSSGPTPGATPLLPNQGRVIQQNGARVLCIADVRGNHSRQQIYLL